ncbi:Uncharacterised protein g7907 [Pycnogonum litorale]
MADEKESESASEAPDKTVTIFDELKKLIRPLTFQNVCTYYLPAVGAASYSLFSINILNPDCVMRLFSSYRFAVTNSLLFNSHLGTGLFLYFRPHMQKLHSCYHRIMFSTYGAILFNFGSILLWAVTKDILPDNPGFRATFGICTSLCLLSIGKEYFDHIDVYTGQD